MSLSHILTRHDMMVQICDIKIAQCICSGQAFLYTLFEKCVMVLGSGGSTGNLVDSVLFTVSHTGENTKLWKGLPPITNGSPSRSISIFQNPVFMDPLYSSTTFKIIYLVCLSCLPPPSVLSCLCAPL